MKRHPFQEFSRFLTLIFTGNGEIWARKSASVVAGGGHQQRNNGFVESLWLYPYILQPVKEK